jgi:MFS superfamily sulfate permease-like transporter
VPRVPASLVAVLFGILMVALLGLDKQGVAIVGTIPRGLPTPGWPSLKLVDYLGLLPGACGVILVLFAEHISAAQKFAVKHHYDLDANQELIALGVSNFLAGLFGGFAGGGILSKTTVNEVAGARTQISGMVSLVLVLVTLLVLTPLFYYLPDATLGAIVIHAVPGLLIFRLNAPMYFANDEPLRERIKELVSTADSKIRAVLLDLEASNHLDLSSADMLAELVGELKAQRAELLLAYVRAPIRDLLSRSGVAQTIGEKHIYPFH